MAGVVEKGTGKEVLPVRYFFFLSDITGKSRLFDEKYVLS